MNDLKELIREVPDFPKPGILFYDITTLLQSPGGLTRCFDALESKIEGEKFDKIVGIESRGFLFGPAIAERHGAGFVPVRKPGKLPWKTVERTYALEYGEDTVQIHQDAIQPGDRVLIVDDLIATGGTARASAELVEEMGGTVGVLLFLIELTGLAGREALGTRRVESVLSY